MKETYLVCHCGKEKTFEEKSKALAHAEALDKLGYDVKLYYVLEGLFIQQKVFLFMSKGTQDAEALRRFREVTNGIIKG